MQSVRYKPIALALLFFLNMTPGDSAEQAKHKHNEKTDKGRNVWYYDGDVFFETNGSLPYGVCFRVHGHISTGDLFNGLKTIDNDQSEVFQPDNETVTMFPDSVT